MQKFVFKIVFEKVKFGSKSLLNGMYKHRYVLIQSVAPLMSVNVSKCLPLCFLSRIAAYLF